MKKIIVVFSIMICALFGSEIAYSQAPAAQQKQAQAAVIISPSMPIDYMVFAVNALSTIEIQGNEVDAFLVCKNFFESEIKKFAAENKRPEDVVTFGIQLDIAQSTVSFLNRAKLIGANAPKYKAFIDALVLAAKNYKPEQK